jgi:hypothetical protein
VRTYRAGVLLRRRTTRHKRALLAVQQCRAPNGAKGTRNSGDFAARTAAPLLDFDFRNHRHRQNG